jgi:hypothetical protein
MVGKRYVCLDVLSQLSLVTSARDDGWQKCRYNYNCRHATMPYKTAKSGAPLWVTIIFFTIKLIACAKDVRQHFMRCGYKQICALSPLLIKHASPLWQGQVSCLCSATCQFVALVNGLHINISIN